MAGGQFWKTLKEFPDYTSMHGIGGITRARYILQRIFWSLAFCGSFGMCLFQVYRLALQFTREQTTTKISVEYGAITFPDVRLCNLNPLTYSGVKTVPDLLQVIDETAKAVNIDPFYVDIPKNTTYYGNYSAGTEDEAIPNAKSFFRIRMGDLGDDSLKSKSQKPKDFIRECFFQDVECVKKQERDEYYGICYRIKMNEQVYKTGPQNSLYLKLNVESSQYIPFITETGGIILDINAPGQKTSLKANGMSLPTGFEINLGLTATKYKRYPGKAEKCRDTTNGDNSNIAFCVEQCLGHIAARQCKCTDEYTYRLSTGKSYDYYCKTDFDFSCLSDVSKYDTSKYCPQCKMPCEETIYTKSLSMTRWPNSFQQIVIDKEINGTEVSREDLLIVRIFFASLTTTIVEEELSYTDENFVSDIGGQLGLWAGLSVLSLAEVLELVVLIFCGCCRNKRQIKTKDEVASQEQP